MDVDVIYEADIEEETWRFDTVSLPSLPHDRGLVATLLGPLVLDFQVIDGDWISPWERPESALLWAQYTMDSPRPVIQFN